MTLNDPGFGDEDLRARFAALRRKEEAQAPEFTMPAPGGRVDAGGLWRPAGAVFALGLCLVAITAALFWRHASPHSLRGPHGPLTSITQWRAPTDFLLQTPGRDLLRTVPAIGVWDQYPKASGPGQKHPEVKRQVLLKEEHR